MKPDLAKKISVAIVYIGTLLGALGTFVGLLAYGNILTNDNGSTIYNLRGDSLCQSLYLPLYLTLILYLVGMVFSLLCVGGTKGTGPLRFKPLILTFIIGVFILIGSFIIIGTPTCTYEYYGNGANVTVKTTLAITLTYAAFFNIPVYMIIAGFILRFLIFKKEGS